MNVCNDTSSFMLVSQMSQQNRSGKDSPVKIVWAVCETPPYVLLEVCVVDGFSFDSRKRAWDPPASQTMNRGSGNRSVINSCKGQHRIRTEH